MGIFALTNMATKNLISSDFLLQYLNLGLLHTKSFFAWVFRFGGHFLLLTLVSEFFYNQGKY